MNLRKFFQALLLAVSLPAYSAHAQAIPTASRGLDLSAFGAVAGVDTGLSGGRNLSFVVGADLGFVPVHGVRPTVEVRGLYPMDGGSIASQRSILFGPRADFLLNHRLRPYGDFLLGRGQMDYQNGGYLFGPNVYVETTTNVYSPGGGVDYDLSQNLSVKADVQFQHWGYSPTPSGGLWSKVGTVGVVYHFTFGPRRTP